MALSTRTAYRGPALRVHHVRCSPEHAACGSVEHAAADLVVLPLRGLFVKHEEGGGRIVADPCHALFFRAGKPYRVSHPVPGGDECLVLEPGAELLSETEFQPKLALAPALVAARKLLSHRLDRGLASALEAEQRSLSLFHAVASLRSPPEIPSPRSRGRHREMVEETKIALARQPAHDWTLGELAQRTHSSPFHLARVFRAQAGMPVHRYQLRVRMAAALDAVLDSTRDFTAIGLDLGFSSHSHFTATFRRTFGVTPSALRKSKILTAH